MHFLTKILAEKHPGDRGRGSWAPIQGQHLRAQENEIVAEQRQFKRENHSKPGVNQNEVDKVCVFSRAPPPPIRVCMSVSGTFLLTFVFRLCLCGRCWPGTCSVPVGWNYRHA